MKLFCILFFSATVISASSAPKLATNSSPTGSIYYDKAIETYVSFSAETEAAAS